MIGGKVSMEEKQKICDLNIPELEKRMLTLFVKERTIAEVAGLTNYGYSSIAQRIAILEAKGWIKEVKVNTKSSRKVYILNTEILDL